ncbi:apolipoprotein N-acyltransferase [Rhodoligotrophos defluvii]|uniref:apolipoprotein N-acyltransferase n=1 Tax=Rhodoligotrophos defluvii TaxID=2561934 RepID=UPI00196090C3|nr:apolipoprotein N-acyltransferase [Rhodoligotrophos defluvii]
MALTGWRRLSLAGLAGVLAALAQPPIYVLPALFVAFPVLVLLLDGVAQAHAPSRRRFAAAFATGWAFGFGYFLLSLYWVGEAFLVEAETYAWMLPLGVVVLPAGMALYWGLGSALAIALWPRGPAPLGVGRLLALSACLSATEWLRGHLFTGFPWALPGYALGLSESLAQGASLVGAYGLTLLMVFAACLPVLLIDRAALSLRRSLPFLATMAFFAGLWTFGAERLSHDASTAAPGPRVRIVQPDIPQGAKWNPQYATEILDLFLELSTAKPPTNPRGLAAVDYLIWPESALPFLLDERADVRGVIGAVLPDNVTLFTGAIRRGPDPDNPGSQGLFYNSLQVIDHTGTVIAGYDKQHLVPFGEYLPFESLLRPLGFRKLVTVPAGFAAGSGPRTLALPGIPPFSPLICYEIIFPGAVADEARRPQWLLNVTNDAWFGQSLGPHQHFVQARFRAIEEGLPLVRSANTGISAVIDPYGRIVEQIGLGERGLIDTDLPSALPPTVYSQYHEWILSLLIVSALLISIRVNSSLSNINWAKSF